MSDWLPASLFVVTAFAIIWIIGARKFRNEVAALTKRRSDLTEVEFIAMLHDECEPDIAEFLWNELAIYWRPALPHPDDDFLKDLSIDPDEPNDWLAGFCRREGLDESVWPDWPLERPTTVRNFARWLSDGRRVARND